MRFFTLLFLTVFLASSCSGVKKAKLYTAKGDYDNTIALSVKQLQKSKTTKDAQRHIRYLEEAFAKAKDEDMRRISFLEKENNRSSVRELYYIYTNMEDRQNKIRPLLPLRHLKSGKEAVFNMGDYSSQILSLKSSFINALYDEADELMARKNKEDYRNAYELLNELNSIEPNHKNTIALMRDAHYYGSDYVYVQINNHSNQIIPQILEEDLMNFNTYGLDDFWTEYHATRDLRINYDYGIDLNFQSIAISPERIVEKEYHRTKEVETEKAPQNTRGNSARTKLEGAVRQKEVVTADITITTQQKNVLVGGTVVYRDLNRNQQINSYPLSTEFIFENIYATYRGDKKALDSNDLNYIRNKFHPFPSNEQMVLDAGDNIKATLKDILRRHKIN